MKGISECGRCAAKLLNKLALSGVGKVCGRVSIDIL